MTIQTVLVLLPVLFVFILTLDMLQGKRWSWPTAILIGLGIPAWLLVNLIERGLPALSSGVVLLGALGLAWVWTYILTQWQDRLRFVLVRSVLIGVLWALGVAFNVLIDPPMAGLTLLTGLLPLAALAWSLYSHRMAIRVQFAALTDEDQDKLLHRQRRAVEKMRSRFQTKRNLAYTLFALGASYTKLERMEEARAVFEEALQLASQMGNVDVQVRILSYLGNTWIEEDPEEAIACYDEAVATLDPHMRRWDWLYRALGWPDFELHSAVLLNNQGSAYLKLNQLSKARPHFEAALDLLDKARIETPRLRVTVFINLSELHHKLGQEAEALRWARDAEVLMDKRHFILPGEVDFIRGRIAKHYRETLGLEAPAAGR